ncbi:meiotic recombination protein spo11, putative [Trypanosoma brucei gambiense DAL972]|uniref:DNA topoisomerase (ATP-hydrolyzing) n=1 Tax=Trypanosoma brucei gambiense (strain MHOM/CI/86/DAL972) TaxID=679716 RepID=C9ZPQ5_TRYB9|nr:meiotic recombination protein spo11, putative [Trypanosoma brucei gambiense DAL972]CBH11383.1 meiotic recombination protein spo11, putative [Trypanosoma brucei gambiense DAL972]|eukprot:XP_011773670.1 meiotic recombination protein spo11, putative [Trypanosoma brucei gambiense DAL972]
MHRAAYALGGSCAKETAAGAAGGTTAFSRKSQRRQVLKAPAFVSSDNIRTSTSISLRDEAVRRMESFVLNVIYEIVTYQGMKYERQRKGDAQHPADAALRSEDGDDACELRSPERQPSGPNLLTVSSQQQQLPRLRLLCQQLLVLRHLYANVQLGVICTQRDVYYRLVRFFPDQGCVNRVIPQLVQQLGLPRQLLGVVPGTRGCVGGSLSFHGIDYGGTRLRVFHYLFYGRNMEEKIFDRVSCVLLTSHGFPTAAALTLLSNLHRTATDVGVPVVALVDYNPSGLSILQQYKHDTGRIQENRYASVHSLRWLGLRGCHVLHDGSTEVTDSQCLSSGIHAGDAVGHIPRVARLPFQPFTQRDDVMISNIIARWAAIWKGCDDGEDAQRVWFREAQIMQTSRVKVELEAIYECSASGPYEPTQKGFSSQSLHKGNFSTWVCRGLFRRDYI